MREVKQGAVVLGSGEEGGRGSAHRPSQPEGEEVAKVRRDFDRGKNWEVVSRPQPSQFVGRPGSVVLRKADPLEAAFPCKPHQFVDAKNTAGGEGLRVAVEVYQRGSFIP